MTILITQTASLSLPTNLFGWIGWIAFSIVLIMLNLRWRSYNQQLDKWHNRVLILIMISVPFTTLFLPSLNLDLGGVVLFLPLFGAVPWFLAAGSDKVPADSICNYQFRSRPGRCASGPVFNSICSRTHPFHSDPHLFYCQSAGLKRP